MSNWDNPSINSNRGYTNGRYNDNRNYNNRDTFGDNMDSSHDGMYNRNNKDYNNHNGDNVHRYGMWRKQQNSGGKFMIGEAIGLVKYFISVWNQVQSSWNGYLRN